ncbi:MAG: hypothetical protein J6U64_01425, partial [Alphaproteobacteria bacterium]|nr:hypothetical protein [Alphaproteobacteria bacterium]
DEPGVNTCSTKLCGTDCCGTDEYCPSGGIMCEPCPTGRTPNGTHTECVCAEGCPGGLKHNANCECVCLDSTKTKCGVNCCQYGCNGDVCAAAPVLNGCPTVPCTTSNPQCYSSAGLYICGPESASAYCSAYNETSSRTCTELKTSTDTCTPYVSAVYESGYPKTGACCKTTAGTVRRLDVNDELSLAKCSSNTGTTYCKTYNTSGICTAVEVNTETCTPYVSAYQTDEATYKTGACCVGSPYVYAVYESGNPKTRKCCSGEVYQNSGENIERCCVSTSRLYEEDGLKICSTTLNGKAYCSAYDTTGKCTTLSVSADANCVPYVTAYQTDGTTPKTGGCCSGTPWLPAGKTVKECCVSDKQVYKLHDLEICGEKGGKAYCKTYDTSGVCTELAVSTDASCKRYVTLYQTVTENVDPETPRTGACCSDTLYQLPGRTGETSLGKCLEATNGIVYCGAYYDNGKCKTIEVETAGRQPYVKSFYDNGQPKTGEVCDTTQKELTPFTSPTTGVNLGLCHTKGYDAYCSKYHEDGGCVQAMAQSTECRTYFTACYDSLCDRPKTVECCTEGYDISNNIGGRQICMPENNMAYCTEYNESGICTQGTYRAVVGTVNTCTQEKEDLAGTCVVSGETAYCTNYNDGKCRAMTYVSGTCTPFAFTYDATGTKKQGSGGCCVGSVYTAKTTTDGKPLEKACCSGTGYSDVSIKKNASANVANGGYVRACVSSGEIAYCTAYDGNNPNVCTGFGSGTGCTPFVSKYADAAETIPLEGSCCDPGYIISELGSGIELCYQSGQTPFCSYYSQQVRGLCTSATVKQGTCTPSISGYWDNDYPMTGTCQ